jgi:integrase
VERREVKPRVVTLAPAQVTALLAASEVYQAAYLRTLLGLGFRYGELTHTRLHDDLDLRDWTWRVQGRGPDARCGCVACAGRGWRPKSKHSTRSLHVPALDHTGQPLAVRAAVLRYLEHHPCQPGDYVFRNPRTDGPWKDTALADDFRRLCERAGVTYGARKARGVTIHATRHTCATELIRAGVGVPEVAALLGDTVEVVVGTYVHLTADDISRAIARSPNY